jgi:hypothetical protein
LLFKDATLLACSINLDVRESLQEYLAHYRHLQVPLQPLVLELLLEPL